MKKTNKSNPLKYFNDQKVKRVAKLTKAQDGKIVNNYRPWDYGNHPDNTFSSLKEKTREKLRKDFISSITNKAKTDSLNKDFPDPKSFSKPDSGKAKEIIKKYEAMNNKISNQKKGGQTKAKKK